DDGPVRGHQLFEEDRQDLVDDRLLGVEVVVEAAGQDSGLLGDLPDGGGLEALLGEEFGRESYEVFPALRGQRGGALRAAATARGRCAGIRAGLRRRSSAVAARGR